MSVNVRIPTVVTLDPSALRDAERAGAVTLRVTTPLTVVEAVSLASTLPVPPGWDTDVPDGWGIACPAGAMLKVTATVEAVAGDAKSTRVARGAPLLVQYAWATPRTTGDGGRRVLVRCCASVDDVNVYPVDIYADQIATLAAIGGAPFRVAGWEVVRLNGRPADGGPLVA